MPDRKYLKTHEWVLVDGPLAVIGISDHAQDALGDITFVELPRIGDTVIQGKECGVIESVKAASDIYAPVGGTVAEVNRALETAPEIVNQEPLTGGWIFKVTGFSGLESEQLMDDKSYAVFLESDS